MKASPPTWLKLMLSYELVNGCPQVVGRVPIAPGLAVALAPSPSRPAKRLCYRGGPAVGRNRLLQVIPAPHGKRDEPLSINVMQQGGLSSLGKCNTGPSCPERQLQLISPNIGQRLSKYRASRHPDPHLFISRSSVLLGSTLSAPKQRSSSAASTPKSSYISAGHARG